MFSLYSCLIHTWSSIQNSKVKSIHFFMSCFMLESGWIVIIVLSPQWCFQIFIPTEILWETLVFKGYGALQLPTLCLSLCTAYLLVIPPHSLKISALLSASFPVHKLLKSSWVTSKSKRTTLICQFSSAAPFQWAPLLFYFTTQFSCIYPEPVIFYSWSTAKLQNSNNYISPLF